MTLPVEIIDADIEIAERIMKCRFDEKRREILKCGISRDVQAGPGSGKTTLLVAKLAILSSRWKWRDRGICVLSHTNVARQEVEKRLAHHSTAHKLLSYPHFIGTIQVFVDQFLAIPYLRSQGIEISLVDDDRFAAIAERAISSKVKPLYPLLKRQNGREIIRQLGYEGSDLNLGTGAGEIPAGMGTNVYNTLKELKDSISGLGIFRFDDMYAFAEAYIERYPSLIEILRTRFPWVLIDEMQDTDRKQHRLLETIFSEGCVLQKLGDINQGIYRSEITDEGEANFPKQGCIELPDCKRLCAPIAAFASQLTAVKQQTLVGNQSQKSLRHTIFIFDRTTLKDILPAFGDLLLEEYREGFPEDFIAKAIGFRKSGSDPTKVPFTICDYWEAFQPDFTTKSVSPVILVDFVRKARHTREETKECGEAYNMLTGGVVQFLQRQGARDENGARFTKTRLIDALEGRDAFEEFQKLLLDLCVSSKRLDEKYWDTVRRILLDLMRPWIGENLTNDAIEFMNWSERVIQFEGDLTGHKGRVNVYRHERPNGIVNIDLSTIHSVKGETHSATLVLETYYKGHDLQQLLPFLSGGGSREEVKRKKLLCGHMKRIFVAMTRPKELICLGIHKDHLREGDIYALRSFGWNVMDLGRTCEITHE